MFAMEKIKRKIRTEISSKIMERTELEQTLLACINEVILIKI